MRSRRFLPALTLLLLGASASGAEAQLGPILDWITKMSGPGVARIGLQYSAPLSDGPRALELSPAAMFGFKVSDGDGTDGDSGLGMLSGQVTLDVPVVLFSPEVALLAIGGLGGHVFMGDDFDNFSTISFPAMLGLRWRPAASWTFRIAGGVNVFRFGSDAFAPLDIGVPLDSCEAAPGIQTVFLFKL